jgi:hypothetical protein
MRHNLGCFAPFAGCILSGSGVDLNEEEKRGAKSVED